MNCKDCKHWSRTYEGKGCIRKPFDGIGTMIEGIELMNFPNGYNKNHFEKIEGSEKNFGMCSKLFEEDKGYLNITCISAYSTDCEAILTNENFGCIKFEKK